MAYEPSSTLKDRTFLGLICAQITAAFNDQAIHIVANLYCVDVLVRALHWHGLDEKAVVMGVTASFILPFILFSPFAGQLADKHGKRSIMVLWKAAELGITALALFGLLLPASDWFAFIPLPTRMAASAGIVALSVFMMGTHSAFFVPAKYGCMPEILAPSVLSRGNGVLEGTSFVSQLLGTTFGAYLYVALKSKAKDYVPTGEWKIAAALFALALVGFVASLLMRKVPAANPGAKFTWNWWAPLAKTLRTLRESRALLVAVLGIGFLAFMTLYLRQSLLYGCEMRKNQAALKAAEAARGQEMAEDEGDDGPDFAVEGAADNEKTELELAALLAMVGLGIGIGSASAGALSGPKLELGLTPLGGLALFVLLLALAWAQRQLSLPAMMACLVGAGAAAGLYIVPLYTLMQQRAPKSSKGSMVAASNVVNMAFGVASLGAFFGFAGLVERVRGYTLKLADYNADPAAVAEKYAAQLAGQTRLPAILFAIAAGLTVLLFVLLGGLLRDFLYRGLLWATWGRRRRVRVEGLAALPNAGPVVLLTPTATLDEGRALLASADRAVRLFTLGPEPRAPLALFARHAGWTIVPPGGEAKAVSRLQRDLARGGAVAVPQGDDPRSAALRAAIPPGTPTLVVELADARDPAGRTELVVAFRTATA